MNNDFNDNMDKTSPDHQTEQREDYQFLSEIHKRRKLTARQVFWIVAGVCVLAVLFGAIAAAVFSAVSASYARNHPDPVRMSTDSEAFSVVESPESGADSEISGDAAAEVAQTSGMEEDPAALQREAEENSLINYTALNAKMKEIGDASGKSVVHVMGIHSTEDWLHNTDTSTVTKSGLIVADTGDRLMILTDHDGLDGAQQIAVEMPDDTIVQASLVKKDPVTNLAVIAVSEGDLDTQTRSSFAAANLGNSYGVKTGDSVIAIGSPLGYSGSVVYGEVTSVENTVSVTDGEYNLITTNIQGSSSGNGFLINTDGEIIGMIFQKYATQNSSVVTAVPVSLLKQLTEVLCNGGALSYAGIHGRTVSEEVSESSGIPKGVYVTQVDADSPALAAGLAAGDVITEMNGQRTGNMRVVHNQIAALNPGDAIPVTVQRLGAEGYVKFEFELTIGEIK